jgi:hypothetical protein
MDTIASMRAFVAVAKTGSFTAAAQKLDLVPSVVTKPLCTQLTPSSAKRARREHRHPTACHFAEDHAAVH